MIYKDYLTALTFQVKKNGLNLRWKVSLETMLTKLMNSIEMNKWGYNHDRPANKQRSRVQIQLAI